MKLLRIASAIVRSRTTASGMSGLGARRSHATNPIAAAAAAATRNSITGEPQSYSTPPQDVTSTAVVVVAASNAMPAKSIVRVTLARADGTSAKTNAPPSKPAGRLMKKAQRHDRWSTKRPPVSGPAMKVSA